MEAVWHQESLEFNNAYKLLVINLATGLNASNNDIILPTMLVSGLTPMKLQPIAALSAS